MNQPATSGISTTLFCRREARSLGSARRGATGLFVALVSGAFLLACGTDLVDARSDTASASGSTGGGGAACSGACKPTFSGPIAASGTHTCAVAPSGALRCWGWNIRGQLGNGLGASSFVPVDVMGLSSDIVSVATGDVHTCAVTAAGAVKCWGDNHNGRLGDGSMIQSFAPVAVAGLPSSRGVVGGGAHACSLSVDGGMACWGMNVTGALGDGSTADSPAPVGVPGMSTGLLGIAAGYLHTCAITPAGGAKCWGYDELGQLGNGTTTDSHAPVDVVGLPSGVVSVVGGYAHTCAITTSGAVECWGAFTVNGMGTNALQENSLVPVAIAGISSVVALAAGSGYTCALTSAGGVKCWGMNRWGALGNGSTVDSAVPVDVVGLSSGVIAIAAGGAMACAVLESGGVKCWGYNAGGQLGDGTNIDRHAPVDVVGF
jgi:alpha-tubulin suppressor-like RCC1 family protein